MLAERRQERTGDLRLAEVAGTRRRHRGFGVLEEIGMEPRHHQPPERVRFHRADRAAQPVESGALQAKK